ncbi:hypothetical protein ONE63_000442 [Megalurothrips usitatus]|uniref:Importin-13 n=1 Tax=Megalurothrips usitatus TaxID=439358 RepID=A0AAV7XZ19_9NEOP|nr:hypothetical protein ONE63_000442 [Megalurothrips usitatus]
MAEVNIENMPITAENLQMLISHFYSKSHDPAEQMRAHSLLSQAQSSMAAWSFVWDLLYLNKPAEVQFYAASTLHLKLVKFWPELPPEQRPALREKLMSTIMTFSSGPKIVLSRLCIVMATMALQMLPEDWPNAVEEIMEHLTSERQTQIPADRSLWILLETLTVLAEETQTSTLQQQHRENVRAKLDRSAPEVFKLLERTIPDNVPDSSGTNVDNVCQALRCSSAWLQLQLPLSLCDTLSTKLINIVNLCSQGHDISNAGMADLAVEALTNLLCRPNSQKFPATVMQIMEKYMVLMDVVQFQLNSSEPDEGLVCAVFTLMVSVAESHSHLLLESLLQPEGTSARNTAMRLIQGILLCSNMPGQYPLEENCSQMAFGFWYMLQDDVIGSDPIPYHQLVQLLAPVYATLAEILLHKSMLPEKNDLENNWNSEDRESFRCYRQDVADTLLYCYSILHESLLQLYWNKLEAALLSLQTNSSSWRHLETVLHGFLAVADVVPMEEDRFLPNLLAGLKALPLNHLDVRVAGTVLDTVGAYAEWINHHPVALRDVMPLLLLGLDCEEVATSATMALKDLTRDCQPSITPFCSPILRAAKQALSAGHLKANESIRMMYIVGRVLSICPLPDILSYLDEVLLPRVTELQELAHQVPNAHVKASILLRLRMVSTLFSTLDTRIPTDDESGEAGVMSVRSNPGQGDAPEVQPVQVILRWLLPVLKSVIERWASDEHIMTAVSSSLKYASGTLLDDCKPLLPEMVNLLAAAFRLHPQASLLDTAKQLLVMFALDSDQVDLMRALLADSTTVFLRVCGSSLSLSPQSDLIQAFYNMHLKLMKKDINMVAQSVGENLSEIFKCGIVSLSLPECGASKASAAYLSYFILGSREMPQLNQIVKECGQELTTRILRCIGGETPRQSLDPIIDVLLALNKKYCEDLSRWLTSMLTQENFPTHRPSVQEKEQFAQAVLRERANKRKLQEKVRAFSLLCRGLVNEYGEQQNPFF